MRIFRHVFWKPQGCVPALKELDASHGVLSRREAAIAGANQEQHPLIAVELAGGKIIGDLRLASTSDDFVIGDTQGLLGCPDPKNHYLLRRRRIRLAQFHRGTALLLATTNSDNYYHWMLDSLPRWKILQTAGWTTYDWVLLPGKPTAIQDEMLDRLGVPLQKRLRCSKNFVHQFERLVVPAMPFPVEMASSWACVWLRSLFEGKKSGPEKVYLRRGTGRRRLVNEPDLESALRLMGFVSMQPDRLTVTQQAELLSSARCVVAPHGAALTNLIFAPPGALMMELFHPQHKNRCYINLAVACGHRYACLDGRDTQSAITGQLEYEIDVEAVMRMIGKQG
jgi:capsular polysaccharide biosynthesis protein